MRPLFQVDPVPVYVEHDDGICGHEQQVEPARTAGNAAERNRKRPVMQRKRRQEHQADELVEHIPAEAVEHPKAELVFIVKLSERDTR